MYWMVSTIYLIKFSWMLVWPAGEDEKTHYISQKSQDWQRGEAQAADYKSEMCESFVNQEPCSRL